jgi:hypothetical protein
VILQVVHQTRNFADSKPTRKRKIIQKAGRDNLRVPREDAKESSRIDRVVEAK